MILQSIRLIYATLGIVFLAVGIIGVFVPLLPSTPFVLLAAFFFSKSSRRLHDWLLSRPALGPMIVEWREHRVIRRRAKIVAVTAIVLTFGATVAFVTAPAPAKGCVVLLGVALLAFVLTRRSLPPDETR